MGCSSCRGYAGDWLRVQLGQLEFRYCGLSCLARDLSSVQNRLQNVEDEFDCTPTMVR